MSINLDVQGFSHGGGHQGPEYRAAGFTNPVVVRTQAIRRCLRFQNFSDRLLVMTEQRVLQLPDAPGRLLQRNRSIGGQVHYRLVLCQFKVHGLADVPPSEQQDDRGLFHMDAV